MTKTVTEWAVECGYISLITNAILDKHEEGKDHFQRKFEGNVEAFRDYCRSQQRRAEAEGRHDTVVYIEQCLDELKDHRDPFSLPEHPADRPLVEHPFYHWLFEHENELDTRRGDAVYQWLNELGFKVGVHKITEDELKTLHYVQDTYQNLWMPTRTPHRLYELFCPAREGKVFWLRGSDERVVPSPLLTDLIEQAAPTYPLSPSHYYFEVINGTLFICYQHIIGSRRLCPVDPNDKED